MALLSLLLLLGMAPLQDDQLQPLGPNELMQGLEQYQRRQAQDLLHQVQPVESADNTCLAIRSYIFKREDAQAPVLIGTTTCTPAQAFQQRSVVQPRARLIPAN